ncbi:MAG TPA: aminotransferase class IV, partial [Polyangiaceae bacterium]|nr:aminotransferase class IV [Polyangiaceae bacterium]
QAVISVFDRGFLYGDSVFEALRTHHGRLALLDAHLERLARGAHSVLISLPVPLSTLREEVLAAVRAHAAPECYVRLMLTRGTARALGLDPELAETPRRVVLVTELKLPPPEVYERGIAAITFRVERPSDAPSVASAKIGNYLVSVLAMRKARELGAGEALLEDARGDILEGSTSNVFAVFAGTLVTPPESAAILPGITRARVLEAAREAGIPVELRAVARAELAHADEVFVTSSIREIVPVVKLDAEPVGSGTPGPVARELLRRYRAALSR